MATVQRWTGAETKALRQAMRLTIRAFAAHLGVDARTVTKWEARSATITLLPDNQALMDTALGRAPDDVQTRFTQTVGSSNQERHNNEAQLVTPVPDLRTGPDSLAPLARNDGNDSPHPLTELASLLLAHVAATSAATADPPSDREAHVHQLADYLRAWVAAVNRRDLLRLLPGATVVGYPFAARAEPEATLGLDIHPVEHFQQMKKVLMDNDNMFGARSVVLLVQEQIGALQRLRLGCQGGDRRELLRVQTQFAELCGWLYQDLGDYRAAVYWSGRALEWAHMCGDHDAIGYILARKSHLAADMGDPAEAVDAAEAALTMAPQASVRVAAIATTFAAQGHALQGDRVNCERSCDAAQNLLARREADPDSPWAHIVDLSYIEVYRARGLTFLGEYGAAIDSFRNGISGLPPGFRRDRGVYLAREAVAHVSHGDVEQASAVGLEALAIGAETGSARIMGELKHLDAALGKFPSSSSVVDFHDAMNATFSPWELAGHTIGRTGD